MSMQFGINSVLPLVNHDSAMAEQLYEQLLVEQLLVEQNDLFFLYCYIIKCVDPSIRDA